MKITGLVRVRAYFTRHARLPRTNFMIIFKVCGSPASRQGLRHVALQSVLRLFIVSFRHSRNREKKKKKEKKKAREERQGEDLYAILYIYIYIDIIYFSIPVNR